MPYVEPIILSIAELQASHHLLQGVTKDNLNEYFALIYPQSILSEARRANPTFTDRVIESLVNEPGAIVFSRFATANDDSSMYCFLCDYFMDRVLVTRDPQIRQVVLMDVVMDSRPYRLPELAGCRVYELHRNAVVLGEKERLLKKGGAKLLAAERYTILADPTKEGWQEALLARGFNPNEPTFWMIGNYISNEKVHVGEKLVSTVNSLSAPHSQIFASMFSGHKLLLSSQKQNPVPYALRGMPEMHGDNAHVFRSLSRWNVELIVRRDEENKYYGAMWDQQKLGTWTLTDPKDIRLGPWFLVRFTKS